MLPEGVHSLQPKDRVSSSTLDGDCSIGFAHRELSSGEVTAYQVALAGVLSESPSKVRESHHWSIMSQKMVSFCLYVSPKNALARSPCPL